MLHWLFRVTAYFEHPLSSVFDVKMDAKGGEKCQQAGQIKGMVKGQKRKEGKGWRRGRCMLGLTIREKLFSLVD
jgi:hypothetical protein